MDGSCEVVRSTCGHHFHLHCARKRFISRKNLRCCQCNQLLGGWVCWWSSIPSQIRDTFWARFWVSKSQTWGRMLWRSTNQSNDDVGAFGHLDIQWLPSDSSIFEHSQVGRNAEGRLGGQLRKVGWGQLSFCFNALSQKWKAFWSCFPLIKWVCRTKKTSNKQHSKHMMFSLCSIFKTRPRVPLDSCSFSHATLGLWSALRQVVANDDWRTVCRKKKCCDGKVCQGSCYPLPPRVSRRTVGLRSG